MEINKFLFFPMLKSQALIFVDVMRNYSYFVEF